MEKYSETIKKYTFEQLVYERAILEKEKDNLYIRDKELKEEFKRIKKEGMKIEISKKKKRKRKNKSA